MRKSIAAAVMSAMCLVSSYASATEVYFAPRMDNTNIVGNPWTWTGNVTVTKGLTLNCVVSVKVNGNESATDGHGSFSHTDISDVLGLKIEFASGDPLCPLVGPGTSSSGATYNVATDEITFPNVFVPTISIGDCLGSLVAHLNPTTKVLTVAGSIPGASGGSPCSFNGTLELINPTPSTAVVSKPPH